eukprot:SM002588S09130  [mRNA]  locus=s2588:61:1005:+ [translate_table: standard]
MRAPPARRGAAARGLLANCTPAHKAFWDCYSRHRVRPHFPALAAPPAAAAAAAAPRRAGDQDWRLDQQLQHRAPCQGPELRTADGASATARHHASSRPQPPSSAGGKTRLQKHTRLRRAVQGAEYSVASMWRALAACCLAVRGAGGLRRGRSCWLRPPPSALPSCDFALALAATAATGATESQQAGQQLVDAQPGDGTEEGQRQKRLDGDILASLGHGD